MIDNQKIAALRLSYTHQTLDINEVLPDAMAQFEVWFAEALQADLLEPNAMLLATADANGYPSARTVLLKHLDTAGFVFYTNYESRKGQQLAANPHCALVFSWLPLERQVRIEGKAERVSREMSAAYFESRPRGSQIGATVSPQSRIIESRAELEERTAALEAAFADTETLPLPNDWGGYRVRPTRIEFWQGRRNRLHDRLCYTLQPDGSWQIARLAP